MVTHEEHVARHAKRIILMRDGRIYSDLPREQYLAEEGVIHKNKQQETL